MRVAIVFKEINSNILYRVEVLFTIYILVVSTLAYLIRVPLSLSYRLCHIFFVSQGTPECALPVM